MSYRKVTSKRAKRDIKKLDPDYKKQVRDAIDELANEPRPQSSKRMKGNYKGYWRKRSGNYRIIYEIRDQELVIFVIRAGHRKDIYD
jgi:mRNA interferase RelE/StbE